MKKLFSLIVYILILSCSKEKTDAELLAIDKKELESSLDTEKVLKYKFCKILIKANADKNNNSAEYLKFKTDLFSGFTKVDKLIKKEKLSVVEYFELYQNYRNINQFIKQTDEDTFPTMIESWNYYSDSLHQVEPWVKGIEKQKQLAAEHAVLSALTMLSSDMGREISLYECSKTDVDKLPANELKGLIEFYRGFAFSQKKLLYLSENEYTNNINWLVQNKNIPLPTTAMFFGATRLSDEQFYDAFLSMNYMLRGLDRSMMKREIDEKRSLEDFQNFVNLAEKNKIDNELVTSTNIYLNLKKGENDKAILYLKKLKNSPLMSEEDKAIIDESIGYLANRDPDKVTNGLFDKLFLYKIATKYVLHQMSKINWEEFLIKNNVPHAKEILEVMQIYKDIDKKMIDVKDKAKAIEEDVKNKGNDLLDKAKNILN